MLNLITIEPERIYGLIVIACLKFKKMITLLKVKIKNKTNYMGLYHIK